MWEGGAYDAVLSVAYCVEGGDDGAAGDMGLLVMAEYTFLLKDHTVLICLVREVYRSEARHDEHGHHCGKPNGGCGAAVSETRRCFWVL